MLGAIMQRTHFCTMGAVSDIVNMGDGLACDVGHGDGRRDDRFQRDGCARLDRRVEELYAGPRLIWLSALVGGAMFGFGMVLASGCGSKTLVRIGSGNLKSAVVFVVLGIAAFATLKGITAVVRVDTVDKAALTLASGTDLPSVLAATTGWSKATLAAALGLGLGGALVGWRSHDPEGRSADNVLGGSASVRCRAMWWVPPWRLGHVPKTEHLAGASSRNQFAAHGIAQLRFAGRLHARLADVLQRQGEAADDRHRLGVRCHRRRSPAGAAHAHLSLGRFSRCGRHRPASRRRGADGGRRRDGARLHDRPGTLGAVDVEPDHFVALAAIIGGAVAALRYQVWLIERAA